MVGRRVVVTGLGAVTPIASGQEALWEGLLAGRTGFAPVESFDTASYPTHVGAEVRGFDAERYVERLPIDELGRASRLAIAASRLAVEDAELGPNGLEPAAAGVAMGTTSGEAIEIERFNDRYLQGGAKELGPELVRRYPCHLIAVHVAAELGCAGPNLMLPAACAAGNYAIAHAYDVLRSGEAELMLAGGADAFSRITYTGFARLRAMAPAVCQPFDRDRQGMIPGEGAGVLVLEPLERARARGARIYAEIAGYGLSCDAHHMTAAHPQGAGAVRAMRQALAEAGVAPEEVSYISAHGTGTPTNDRLETLAVKALFGAAAHDTPMSSIKSMLGHTMGAASAIEAVACALAVAHDRIPPTVNYEHPDPECDLDYVTEGARELEVEVAMNNAYAFGGNNASVLFRKLREAA